MTGPYESGLFRIPGKKKYRFFRVNNSTSGSWTIREFKDGNLHSLIPGSKKNLTPKVWQKLERWQ